MFKIILFGMAKILVGVFASACGLIIIYKDQQFNTTLDKVVGGILFVSGLICLLSFII